MLSDAALLVSSLVWEVREEAGLSGGDVGGDTYPLKKYKKSRKKNTET